MKVLVIAPHPDDETLGCGGTLYRHKKEGDELYWIIVTGISEDTGWSESMVKKRDRQINAVSEKYRFSDVFNFRLPTTKIDTLPLADLIAKITDVYKKVEPEIIYMPFSHDVHTDHQLIAKGIQSTFKWFRFPHIKKVLMYETLSETELNFIENKVFRPNVFINISDFLDDKIEVMKTYESEMGDFPFPRSGKTMHSLSAFRGSQSGFEAAEAFELVYERKL
ncbi:MAG: GlcNAc-PI de-N-acetylase [Candidatus Marinimicrobia bacterium]|nr:GlcNAc-PI de-N-acetylase [Candidatus Neomarinimicrobiota bacterium]|tara:strand:+ start:81397 stop:82062 length:666 start_codon:yes stop_codon:yes gene_type:complete